MLDWIFLLRVSLATAPLPLYFNRLIDLGPVRPSSGRHRTLSSYIISVLDLVRDIFVQYIVSAGVLAACPAVLAFPWCRVTTCLVFFFFFPFLWF